MNPVFGAYVSVTLVPKGVIHGIHVAVNFLSYLIKKVGYPIIFSTTAEQAIVLV